MPESTERIIPSSKQGFDEVEFVAVAIQFTRKPDRHHMGILNREPNGGDLNLLHLGSHNKLENEEPKEHFHWINVDIDESRARQLSAQCRRVWNANKNYFPYGFSSPNECFDIDTAQLLFGEDYPDFVGLTCATLVLAVFGYAGFHLVEYDTWPENREDDKDFQEEIIRIFIGIPGIEDSHIDKMRKDVGKARFRPLEVAGAALAYPPPAKFEIADQMGQLVSKKLIEEANS